MNAAKWKIIKETFSEIVDSPLAERSRILENADAEIRVEVEKLIFGYENADDFIERPVLIEQGIAEAEDRLIGVKVDGYLIKEKIGAGGMGAVYLAERINSDFKQKVALKIIKRGMDSEAILRRFARERKILSGLKHPNIAQMIDGGISAENLPFFVMEFVEGVSLNHFCAENNLTIKERLEIFRRICAAVEYAHQNLIVHRDLKPSNILVTKDGTPKLLDFGIAKLLSDDDSAATETQGKIFTPEYASPEQILGKTVTTATDVYSLGVILYEILTEHRPFQIKGKSFDEIVKNVCETEPPKPSEAVSSRQPAVASRQSADIKLTSENKGQTNGQNQPETNPKFRIQNSNSLKGDLDNIVLKALRKEPSERYASVRHLSEDVGRFLNDLPVLARPQTFKYRFEKYVRRHRAGVLAAALVLISLVGGTSVAAWQAVEARRERAKAERRFNEVRGLANTILFDHYERIKTLPGATEARTKLVSDALQYLDKLAHESEDNPDLQRELVAAYRKLGTIQGLNTDGGNSGEDDAARENYLKALTIQENLIDGGNSNIEDQRNLGKIYIDVSELFEKENERGKRAELAEKGLRIFQTLRTSNPNQTQREADLANALWSWANIVRVNGDNDGAIEIYQQAAEIYVTLVRENENQVRYQRNAALTYKNIGSIYSVKKDYQTALEFYRKAFEFDSRNAASAPDNVQAQMDLSFTYKSLGRAFDEIGEREKAVENLLLAIAIQEKICAADAKNKFASNSLAESYRNIADVYRDQGDLAAAEINYQKCRSRIEDSINATEIDLNKLKAANFFWSLGDFFLKKSESENSKNADLKTASENLSTAKNIYQTLKDKNILDPAFYENVERISDSLDKANLKVTTQ